MRRNWNRSWCQSCHSYTQIDKAQIRSNLYPNPRLSVVSFLLADELEAAVREPHHEDASLVDVKWCWIVLLGR